MDALMHAAGTSRLFRRFLRVHRKRLTYTRPGPIAVVPNVVRRVMWARYVRGHIRGDHP